MTGSVPSSRPSMMCARSRSKPPPAPEAFSARAIAEILAIAAAAWTPGRNDPVSVAVPSSSGYRLTRAFRSASLRRCSAPAGSAAMTARRRHARSCPVLCRPAAGNTRSSTASATRSDSPAVASAISRVRARSIVPADNAAPVPASCQRSCTPSAVQPQAPSCDIPSASATCAAACGGSRVGRPEVSAPIRGSAAAHRDAIIAAASSSRACAHDATRRHAAARAGRSASPVATTWTPSSHAASAGPAGNASATRPGTAAGSIPAASAASATASSAARIAS